MLRCHVCDCGGVCLCALWVGGPVLVHCRVVVLRGYYGVLRGYYVGIMGVIVWASFRGVAVGARCLGGGDHEGENATLSTESVWSLKAATICRWWGLFNLGLLASSMFGPLALRLPFRSRASRRLAEISSTSPLWQIARRMGHAAATPIEKGLQP